MEDQQPDFKAQLSVMRIIHTALGIVPTLFGAFVYYINTTDPTGETTAGNEILLYIPVGLLLVALPTSSYLFRSRLNEGLANATTLHNKLAVFQTAHIVRMSLFEMTGLFSAVVCFITANNYNLIILIGVIVIFMILFPSSSKVGMDLSLSVTEREQLEKS